MAGLTEATGSSLLLDDDLASVTSGKGASLVAVEDAAANFTGVTVEAVLAELFGLVGGSSSFLNATVIKATNYTIIASDEGKLFNVTGTTIITLLAATTAGAGFVLAIRNSGSGSVTVDGDAAETVNGVATLVLAAGQWAILTCDGTNWSALAYTPAAGSSTAGLASVDIAPVFQYNGDSSDGAFSSVGASTLSTLISNHTTFALNSGHTLTIDTPVSIIRAATSITIDGTLNMRGVDIVAPIGNAEISISGGGGAGGGGGIGYDDFSNIIMSGGDSGEEGSSSSFVDAATKGKGAVVARYGSGTIAGSEAPTTGATGIAVTADDKTTIKELLLSSISALSSGGNGGGGGSGNTAAPGYVIKTTGGVGGKAGGLLLLIAPTIIINGTGVLNLSGEVGANGAAGNRAGSGGGGGGGAGGVLLLVSPTITNTGTTTVTAGAGGAAGGTSNGAGAGAAGGTGAAGYTYTIDPTA